MVTSNMKPRSQKWWIKFIVTAKIKGDTSKESLVYCCYQDVVSPMSDEIYDEGFQEDVFDENVGGGIQYLYLSIRNRIMQASKIRMKGLIIILGYVKCWNPL